MYSANSGRCHVNIPTIVIPLTQGRLNAWAHGAVARGPHEYRGPMIIYVCYAQHAF